MVGGRAVGVALQHGFRVNARKRRLGDAQGRKGLGMAQAHARGPRRNAELVGPEFCFWGGGLDTIGLELRYFREGHPGVIGHTAN